MLSMLAVTVIYSDRSVCCSALTACGGACCRASLLPDWPIYYQYYQGMVRGAKRRRLCAKSCTTRQEGGTYRRTRTTARAAFIRSRACLPRWWARLRLWLFARRLRGADAARSPIRWACSRPGRRRCMRQSEFGDALRYYENVGAIGRDGHPARDRPRDDLCHLSTYFPIPGNDAALLAERLSPLFLLAARRRATAWVTPQGPAHARAASTPASRSAATKEAAQAAAGEGPQAAPAQQDAGKADLTHAHHRRRTRPANAPLCACAAWTPAPRRTR